MNRTCRTLFPTTNGSGSGRILAIVGQGKRESYTIHMEVDDTMSVEWLWHFDGNNMVYSQDPVLLKEAHTLRMRGIFGRDMMSPFITHRCRPPIYSPCSMLEATSLAFDILGFDTIILVNMFNCITREWLNAAGKGSARDKVRRIVFTYEEHELVEAGVVGNANTRA